MGHMVLMEKLMVRKLIWLNFFNVIFCVRSASNHLCAQGVVSAFPLRKYLVYSYKSFPCCLNNWVISVKKGLSTRHFKFLYFNLNSHLTFTTSHQKYSRSISSLQSTMKGKGGGSGEIQHIQVILLTSTSTYKQLPPHSILKQPLTLGLGEIRCQLPKCIESFRHTCFLMYFSVSSMVSFLQLFDLSAPSVVELMFRVPIWQ